MTVAERVMHAYSQCMRAAKANDVPYENVTFTPCEHPSVDFTGTRSNPQSFVYFIVCNEFVKIGYSTDPIKRMESMTTGNPYPLKLARVMFGDVFTERMIHHQYSEYYHDREWFRLEGELKELLERGAEQAANDISE